MKNSDKVVPSFDVLIFHCKVLNFIHSVYRLLFLKFANDATMTSKHGETFSAIFHHYKGDCQTNYGSELSRFL